MANNGDDGALDGGLIKTDGEVKAETYAPVNIVGSNNVVTQSISNLPTAKRIEFNIQDCIESFTGRKEILEEIHTTIQSNRSVGNPTVISQSNVVTGMGGIGKSETARKYISLFKKDFAHVLWIDAENSSQVRNSFLQISWKIPLPTTDAQGNPLPNEFIIENVYDHLCRKLCLIIFDNALSMDPDVGEDGVRDFLPKAIKTDWEYPAIIITTRKYKNWSRMKIIQLLGLTSIESYELLRTQLEFEDNPQNQQLSNEIREICEGLPLVIQQVISIIKSENENRMLMGEPPYSLEEFMKEFHGGKDDYLKATPDDSPVSASAYQIFCMAFQKLLAKQLGSLGLKCLDAMSLLNPDNIPTKLLLALLPNEDKGQMTRSLQLLGTYNLVTIGAGYLKIHRVIQQVTICRNQSSDLTALKSKITEMVQLFRECLEKMPPSDDKRYEILENGFQLSKQVSKFKVVQNCIQFCEKLAQGLSLNGKHKEAEKIYEEMVKKSEGIVQLRYKNQMASALSKQRDFGKALKISKEAVRQSESLGWSFVLECKSTLAGILSEQGNFSEASKINEETLRLDQQFLGNNNFNTLNDKGNLGFSYLQKGGMNIFRAAPLLKEVMDERTRLLGPYHEHTIISKSHYAVLLSTMGLYADAVRINEDLFEYHKKQFGLNHKETLITANELAVDYYQLGKYQEQAQILEYVADQYLKDFGETSEDVIKTRANLASAYLQLGRNLPTAVSYFRAAVQYRVSLYGEYFEDTWGTKMNLAVALEATAQLDEAIEIYGDILNQRIERLGRRHFSVSVTCLFLVCAISARGR